jgi:glycosyltransferase involved in cell wall biosynthesis
VTTRPLRIGVDGRAFSSVAGGVRRYVHEVYAAIHEIDPDATVVAIGAADPARLPSWMAQRPAVAFPTNLGWMAASIPVAARGARLDVYHAPAYTAPLWGVHPQALTIHDVSYERVPEWNAYRNDRLRRWFYRASAHRADLVITDSRFSQGEIAAAYGIAVERIRVVPLGVGRPFLAGPATAGTVPAAVERPFVLHVGDLQVRRFVSVALAAVIEIRREAPACARLTLVCAGHDRGVGESLRRQAAEAGDAAALVLLGAVDEDALVALYRSASALVYPSRYEGFGLPILEAMACGTPVIAARAASAPEVVGDAGLLVAPADVREWREAIARVAGGGEYAAGWRERGRARAAGFTWLRTASHTLAVLRECATSRVHA